MRTAVLEERAAGDVGRRRWIARRGSAGPVRTASLAGAQYAGVGCSAVVAPVVVGARALGRRCWQAALPGRGCRWATVSGQVAAVRAASGRVVLGRDGVSIGGSVSSVSDSQGPRRGRAACLACLPPLRISVLDRSPARPPVAGSTCLVIRGRGGRRRICAWACPGSLVERRPFGDWHAACTHISPTGRSDGGAPAVSILFVPQGCMPSRWVPSRRRRSCGGDACREWRAPFVAPDDRTGQRLHAASRSRWCPLPPGEPS